MSHSLYLRCAISFLLKSSISPTNARANLSNHLSSSGESEAGFAAVSFSAVWAVFEGVIKDEISSPIRQRTTRAEAAATILIPEFWLSFGDGCECWPLADSQEFLRHLIGRRYQIAITRTRICTRTCRRSGKSCVQMVSIWAILLLYIFCRSDFTQPVFYRVWKTAGNSSQSLLTDGVISKYDWKLKRLIRSKGNDARWCVPTRRLTEERFSFLFVLEQREILM